MPRLSLLLNCLSLSAQNWQDISLKYRPSYFGSLIELCDVSMATRLEVNPLERLDVKISSLNFLFNCACVAFNWVLAGK